jgi:hypothetical protein
MRVEVFHTVKLNASLTFSEFNLNFTTKYLVRNVIEISIS